jgi:uncharacterized protein with von Willebrand factor type A (vWA) domain
MSSEDGLRPRAPVSQLVALMRSGGVRIGVGELLGAHAALAAVEAESHVHIYYSLRAVLCSHRNDYAIFDEAYRQTFSRPDLLSVGLAESVATPVARGATPAASEPPTHRDIAFADPSAAAWSDAERLRHADFATLEPDELLAAMAMMSDLVRRTPLRASRRQRAAPRRTRAPRARIDLRGTIRGSMRLGGTPLHLHWRRRTERPRRLVVVCDVSASMRPYVNGLLLFLQAAVPASHDAEAFVFATRLTHVTAELSSRDPLRALAQLREVIPDWESGTRIGECLRTLNCDHGGRVGRGSIVIVLSDGWDRGEPELLAAELERLRRTSHRLIWLNPLKARPGYAARSQGMTAALPFLDEFLAGNSIASLEELVDVLAR